MKYLSRLTALLLAFVLLFSSSVGVIAESDISDLTRSGYDQMVSAAKEAAEAEAAAAAQEAASQPIINEGGVVYEQDIPEQTKRFDIYEVITDAQLSMGGETEITLPQSGKINLSAGTAAQWQIYIPGADMWVNIAGETGDTFALTYAVIGGMLSGGSAKVRALAGDSAAVANVSVAYGSALPPVEEEETFVAEAAAASTFALRRSASTSDANAGIMLLADEENSTYNIIINYVYSDGTTAADPYTATLAAGSSFKATVKNPTIQGYEPYLGNEQIDSIELNYTSLAADDTITVTYLPALVDYIVEHHLQNVNDDNRKLEETESKQALTGKTLKEIDEEAQTPEDKIAKKYEGFYALLFDDSLKIAADGSTRVTVNYDRYYYLMNFDMGEGGYGTEPIYARYGAAITAVNPTRPGYTFKGWSLDGSNIVDLPDTMPADNTRYIAVWEANATAKVSIVIWGENPNDEKYSYITTSELYAKPGSTITYETGNTQCGYEKQHEHSEDCYTCGLTAHTHSAACCTIQAHTHSAECCTVAIHRHTTACYEYGYWGDAAVPSNAPSDPVEGQVYKTTTRAYVYIGGVWYRNYYLEQSSGTILTATCGEEASTHTHGDGSCVYCNQTEHDHTDGNCNYCDLTEHTHQDACFTCTEVEHVHGDNCYITDPNMPDNLWQYVKSDTVTVNADGSTVMNVYYDRKEFTIDFYDGSTHVYQIKEKWGADISEHWPINGTNGKTYTTERWDDKGTTDLYDEVLVYIAVMPSESFKLYKDTTSYSQKTMNYYVEVLPGSTEYDATYTYNSVTKQFDLAFQITPKYGMFTESEDFFELEGFTKWTSNPKYSSGQITKRTTVSHYYTRNKYAIEFYNPTDLLKKQEDVPYQAPLGGYDFVPTQAPAKYEPGSVRFEGWYLNPECTGEKYILANHTMPAGETNGDTSLVLYAKWIPVTHTVSFYLDVNAMQSNTKLDPVTHPDLEIAHGEMVTSIPAEPENGAYEFVGWFYQDKGVEKAFDFEHMPITKDMQVYAKWSSNVLRKYTVYYKVQGTDTIIADTETGSALAGSPRTFDAKGGADLYEGYQEGYFPTVMSHTMTIDINATEENDTNVFTFWYVQRDAVPYIVRYVDEDGNELVTEKVVAGNRKAVVTETFEIVQNYMPDAYQKRLVANPEIDGEIKWITVTDEAGNVVKVHPDNVITFVYSKDTEHAYYKVTHYLENVAGNDWTEHASSQIIGTIGMTEYADEPMDIDGFEHSVTKYVVGGEEQTVPEGGYALTDAGLEIKLYYVRKEYPYIVRYLEKGSGKVLADAKTTDDEGNLLTGKYGTQVTETAIGIPNYTVEESPLNLVIGIEENASNIQQNIITFYYTENTVPINYVAVGPEGLDENGIPKVTVAGKVKLTTADDEEAAVSVSESVKVLSGTAAGSSAIASSNAYKFVGWYSDAACTKEIKGEPWIVGATIKPQLNEDDENVAATYYAKFEHNVSTLTIVKKGLAEGESAIINVTGQIGDKSTQTWTITLTGVKGKDEVSATITGLLVGSTYSVSEDTNWTWSYDDKAVTVTKSPEDGKIQPLNSTTPATATVSNKKTDKWLYDESAKVNDNNNFSTAQ